jgi:hypothetical protein
MIQIASYMPQLAPLPIPIAEHLLKQRRRLLKKTGRTIPQDELEKVALSLLEKKVQEKRQAVYVLMDPLVQAEISISTARIMQVLMAHTPENRLVSSQTLSLWRERNLLRYRERGHPDPENTAALLLARMVDERIRNWLPTTIEEHEPAWWCWRQDTPEMPLVPCPVPLPGNLSPSTLLWTPWIGATWDPHWLKIDDLGAIRWVGAVDEKQHVRWTISQQDLQVWDSEAAALHLNFPACTQEILHTLATLALFRLARTRLDSSVQEFTRASWGQSSNGTISAINASFLFSSYFKYVSHATSRSMKSTIFPGNAVSFLLAWLETARLTLSRRPSPPNSAEDLYDFRSL